MLTRIPIRKLLGVFVIGAVVVPVVLAAQQLLTIEGEVRIAGHQRMSSVTVTLLRSGLPIEDRQTDATGRFRFRFLTPAHYTASVDYRGYERASVDIDPDALTDNVYVTIDLRPTQRALREPVEVVSVREYTVPKNARKEFDRGRKEMQRGNCIKAIGHLEQGLRTFSDDGVAHNDLGNCYRKLGQLDRAEESFERARSLGDSVYFSLNLAEVYVTQKRLRDAETVLTDAIRKSPEQGDAYYALAVMYFDQDRIAEAETLALKADARTHRIADLHLLLAKIYLQKQDTAAIVDQLKAYLREAPDGPLREQVRQSLKAGQ